jgi:hypothetical protein
MDNMNPGDTRRRQLPDAFEPLKEERGRIERMLNRLDVADDATERAYLGSELVRSMSRYEDTLELAAWPVVADGQSQSMTILNNDREALRQAMDVVRKATTHVDARNVHAPDPQGFEDALDDVRGKVKDILAKEDDEIASLDAAKISGEGGNQLRDRLIHAFRNASEKPVPPKTTIGRIIANAAVKLDNNLEDASTPQHPAADTINEDAASSGP